MRGQLLKKPSVIWAFDSDDKYQFLRTLSTSYASSPGFCISKTAGWFEHLAPISIRSIYHMRPRQWGKELLT